VTQAALWLGAWNLGVPVAATQVIMIFSWFVTTGMVTIAIDRRMAPSTLAYLLGFMIASRHPAWSLYVMSAINLVFTLNAAWSWRPDTLRWTEEERRAVEEERLARRRAR